jgi:hypothetical protein
MRPGPPEIQNAATFYKQAPCSGKSCLAVRVEIDQDKTRAINPGDEKAAGLMAGDR